MNSNSIKTFTVDQANVKSQQEEDFEVEQPDYGPAISLIIAALALAVPFYVLSLIWWHEYDLTQLLGSRWRSSRPIVQNSDSGSAIEIIRTTGKLSFGKGPSIKQAKTTEEFLKHLICFAKIQSPYEPLMLYLRYKSYELFTENSVESQLYAEPSNGPPEFAFAGSSNSVINFVIPPTSQFARMSLTFLKNFEGLLPHAPMLTRLAGPQEYFAGRDGAIRHPATIAAGDEYEMEFIPQRQYRTSMKILEVDKDSPYLQLGPLDNKRLRQIASEAIGEKVGISKEEKVLTLASYLERTCTYSTNPSIATDGTPVIEHFLAGDRRGYCQYIAASMVVLCRLHGIPARVAAGMLTYRDFKSGLYMFSDASFHAWPEILTREGWAICDISVSQKEIEENASPGFSLPSVENLMAAVKKAREENIKHGGGTFEEVSEQVAAAAELAKRQRQGREPTRIAEKNWPGRKNAKAVLEPEYLGDISGDSEKQRLSREEKRQRIAEQQRKKNQQRLQKLLWVVGTTLLIIIIWKFDLLERIAMLILWLPTKLWQLLFSQKPRKEESDQSEAIEAADAFAKQLMAVETATQNQTLDGTDVVKLFNHFTVIIGKLAEQTQVSVVEIDNSGEAKVKTIKAFSWASRRESETVAEYFTRIAERLPINEDNKEFLVNTFSASLYGRKPISHNEAQRFCKELQLLLQEAKKLFASTAG